jgi:hypothetical protein
MTDGPIRWASVSKWELDTTESAADPFRCERDGVRSANRDRG